MHKYASVARWYHRCGRERLRQSILGLSVSALVVLIGLNVPATPLGAATPCAGTRVNVVADDPEDLRVACRGAVAAIAFLAERGFAVREPVQVEVVASIDILPDVSVLGIYDAKADVVKVLARSAFSVGTVGDVVLGMPVDEALHASIFAHEVAHAVIHQNIDGRELSLAAHEYLAYAVQLGTMPAAYRERILERFPGAGFSNIEQVSEIVLGFDPDRFAVKAYLHFRDFEDQDAALRHLLTAFPAREAEWY